MNSRFLTPGVKCVVRHKGAITYGDTDIELGGLEQLVHRCQTEAILLSLHLVGNTQRKDSLLKLCDEIEKKFDEGGLESVLAKNSFRGDMSRPRKYEIAGTLNRLRLDKIL